MTSYFNVPHGQAVSITLGEFMEYNYGVSEKDISGTKSVFEIKQSIEELISLTGCKDIDEAKEKLKQLMKRINLKTRLSELNIKTKKDLDLILSNVNTERLQNNPRAITRNGLENILRNIL
jgi:alcohol dehydrogenase class IV